jgi:hypothetical protein
LALHRLRQGEPQLARARAEQALEVARAIKRSSDVALALSVLIKTSQPAEREERLAELATLNPATLSHAATTAVEALDSSNPARSATDG